MQATMYATKKHKYKRCSTINRGPTRTPPRCLQKPVHPSSHCSATQQRRHIIHRLVIPRAHTYSFIEPPCPLAALYGQIRVPPRTTYCLQRPRNIRPNHRHIADESRNRHKEVSKQHEYAIEFDYEADESPAHEDKRYARDKGNCALPFLFAGEEGDGLCGADDECEAD